MQLQFFLVMKTFKISLSSFQVYNTLMQAPE